MLLHLQNLGKSFGSTVIFQHINAAIEDRDRIALIGPNGAGKTTLLNILTEQLPYDEGSLSRAPNLTIGYLRQNGGLSHDGTIESEMHAALGEVFALEAQLRRVEAEMSALTDHEGAQYAALVNEYQALDAQFTALDGYQAEVKISTVLNGMGFRSFPRSTAVETMSGGERTRLLLAKLLVEEPNLLILDEATNHLDFRMLAWLEEYLQGYRGAILTVSHDRYFLDRVTGITWEIEGNTLVSYPAPYHKFLTLRAERLTRMEKDFEKYEQEVARLQDYADRNMARASTSQSAKSRLRMIEHLEEVPKPPRRQKPPIFSFTPKLRPVSDILDVQGLEVRVGEGEEERVLLSKLSLHVKRGERLAIIGENGAGKSSLLRTLVDRLPHRRGLIEWGRNVRCSVYEQDSSDLHPEKTALMELWDRFPLASEHQLRTLLGGLQLIGEEVFQPVSTLSGGERARIKLAILVLEQGNVLVMDEPTNHLDIEAKEALEAALTAFDGTLILVSHDRYLLSHLPTRILRLADGEAESFTEGFDAMQQTLRLREEGERTAPVVAAPVAETGGQKTFYRSKAQRSADAAAKRRAAQLEGEIAAAEGEIEAAQAALCDLENQTDFERLTELTATIAAAEERLLGYYEEWEGLLSTQPSDEEGSSDETRF